MIEATVENYLRARVKARGGWCVKLLPWVETGLPDRMVLLPGARLYFVELKTEKGKLRPSQRRVRRKLGLLGWEVHVLDSKARIDEWFAYR